MKASKLLILALVGCGLSAASLSAQSARGSATASQQVRVGPAPSVVATPALRTVPVVRPVTPRPPGGVVVTPGRPKPVDVRPVDRPGNPRVEAARLKAERIKNAREDAADGNRRRREHRPATGR